MTTHDRPARWRGLLILAGIAVLIVGAVFVQSRRSGPSPAARGDERMHSGQNRLAGESSPYLLQHADNPVDWFPWGDEAIARARTEDKPILLSIGYSTCYWCHVMEEKVFMDPTIAQLMNDHFVNIKLDREERPDLDDIYMTAAQLMIGQGGWPLNVFLTPDLKPFFAGTYFGPTDSPGRPGFPAVLTRMHQMWTDEREQVLNTADQVAGALQRFARGELQERQAGELSPDLLTGATRTLRDSYDARYGGFGGAPKFPTPVRLELLLAEHRRTGDQALLDMVTATLDQRARGGIYDQVGGGFHRYSTDARWLVPHFEKMLYDNAQLARVYLEAYRLTRNPEFRRIADEIFRFVQREMTDESGGFYSALDASTDHEEGKFYTWTEAEIDEALGAQAAFFKAVYGVDGAPNFTTEDGHKKYVLYLPRPVAQLAQEHDLTVQQFWARLNPLREQARAHRERTRRRSHLDDKILTDWNGLMIDAYAYGAIVTGDRAYRRAAERAAEFVLKSLRTRDGLQHMYREGTVRQTGMIEDYAFLAQGLLTLHQTTGDEKWQRPAKELADEMLARFWDDQHGGFFATTAGQPHLLVRMKPSYDGATPSGNAVAAWVLVRLNFLTNYSLYGQRARETMSAFAGLAKAGGQAYGFLLAAYSEMLNENARLAGVTPAPLAGPPLPTSGSSVPAPVTGSVPRPTPPAAGTPPTTTPPVTTTVSNGPTGGPDDLMTMTATARDAGDGTVTVELALRITGGWHVNSNPASQQWLIPTTVDIRGDGVTVEKIEYPRGHLATFEFAPDDPLSVYDGTATIKATLKLRDPARRPRLTVELRYQACNDQACLAPTTLDATLNLAAPR